MLDDSEFNGKVYMLLDRAVDFDEETLRYMESVLQG